MYAGSRLRLCDSAMFPLWPRSGCAQCRWWTTLLQDDQYPPYMIKIYSLDRLVLDAGSSAGGVQGGLGGGGPPVRDRLLGAAQVWRGRRGPPAAPLRDRRMR
jgi:hypothetical protein